MDKEKKKMCPLMNRENLLFEARNVLFFLNKTDNINELLPLVEVPDTTGESFPKKKNTRKWCFKF